MLSERTKVTLEAAKLELEVTTAKYRAEAKALKALIRVLEAQEPKKEDADAGKD